MNYIYDPQVLYHHGVLGQKWGVRRYQNADGTLTAKGLKRNAKYFSEVDTIKKGSTFYRTTANKDEATSGDKYVTYNKSDRDFYIGKGADWIKNISGSSVVYEKQYKATKDLKIATTKDIHKVYDELAKKDKTFTERSAKSYADFLAANSGVKEKALTDAFYKAAQKGKALSNTEANKLIDKAIPEQYKIYSSDKEYRKLVSGQIQDISRNYIDNLKEARTMIKDPNKSSALIGKTAGFGTQEGSKLKQQITDELKRRGYDGMSDVAGMGGSGYWDRETRQAMIIFDTSNNTKDKSTKPINTYMTIEAKQRYEKWVKNTSAYSQLTF